MTEGRVEVGVDKFEDMLNVRVACSHCQPREFETYEFTSKMPVRD